VDGNGPLLTARPRVRLRMGCLGALDLHRADRVCVLAQPVDDLCLYVCCVRSSS
jgi:hypothetical protein